MSTFVLPWLGIASKEATSDEYVNDFPSWFCSPNVFDRALLFSPNFNLGTLLHDCCQPVFFIKSNFSIYFITALQCFTPFFFLLPLQYTFPFCNSPCIKLCVRVICKSQYFLESHFDCLFDHPNNFIKVILLTMQQCTTHHLVLYYALKCQHFCSH